MKTERHIRNGRASAILMTMLALSACGGPPAERTLPDVSGVTAARTPVVDKHIGRQSTSVAGPVRPGCGDYRLLVTIESDAGGVGLRVSGPPRAVDVVWPLSGPGLALREPPRHPRTFTDDNRELFGVEGNEGHERFTARFSLLVSGVSAGQGLQLEMGVEDPGEQGTHIAVYNATAGLTEPGEELLSVRLGEAFRRESVDLCAAAAMPRREPQLTLQPRLLAFFYPWWGTTAEPDPPYRCGGDDFGWIRATERGERVIVTAHTPIARDEGSPIYRQTACWTRVADDHGRRGWIYDVQEPYFLAEQMALARAFGLDGFAVSVHVDNDFEMHFLTETALPVAGQQDFLLAPLYEMPEGGWSGDLERDRATVGEHLRALVEGMAQSPAALRVTRAGRRQIVLFIDPAVLARFVLAEDWQAIRAIVDEAGQPYFLWSGPGAFAWVFSGGVDGVYNDLDVIETYEAPLGLPPYSLRDERRLAYRAAAWAARERGMPLALPVVTGWEGAKAIHPEGHVSLPRDYGAPRDWGRYYRVRWEDALEAAPDWIVITSWNEWAEGTELEASDAYPPSRFDYLQSTWRHACAWRGECP